MIFRLTDTILPDSAWSKNLCLNDMRYSEITTSFIWSTLRNCTSHSFSSARIFATQTNLRLCVHFLKHLQNMLQGSQADCFGSFWVWFDSGIYYLLGKSSQLSRGGSSIRGTRVQLQRNDKPTKPHFHRSQKPDLSKFDTLILLNLPNKLLFGQSESHITAVTVLLLQMMGSETNNEITDHPTLPLFQQALPKKCWYEILKQHFDFYSRVVLTLASSVGYQYCLDQQDGYDIEDDKPGLLQHKKLCSKHHSMYGAEPGQRRVPLLSINWQPQPFQLHPRSWHSYNIRQ